MRVVPHLEYWVESAILVVNMVFTSWASNEPSREGLGWLLRGCLVKGNERRQNGIVSIFLVCFVLKCRELRKKHIPFP